jgi:hypothetical protein
MIAHENSFCNDGNVTRPRRYCEEVSIDDINYAKTILEISSNILPTEPTMQECDADSSYAEQISILLLDLSNDDTATDSIAGNNFTFEDEASKTTEIISLSQTLGIWASTNKISRVAVDELLKILHQHIPRVIHDAYNIPKCAKTLLHTPNNFMCRDLCGGKYFYLGIKNGLLKALNKLNHHELSIPDIIDLLVNVDGIPLYKSSPECLWPILLSFCNSSPFIVAVFYGSSKPNSVHDFVNDFLKEFDNLSKTGFTYEGKLLKITLKAIVADAPARQFIKCIKSHNGYYACERCMIKGGMSDNNMCFIGTNHEPRTDEKFKKIEYKDNSSKQNSHQLEKSPLIQYNINCINQFSLDYMHLVLLGATKRIIMYWICGPYRACRIGRQIFLSISASLDKLQGTFPTEFARQPRSLEHWRRYKATEFRNFLLYSGVVVLKHAFKCKSYYTHFLSLSVSVRILLIPSAQQRTPQLLAYAQELLNWFVIEAENLYSKKFVSLNIHSLVHLPHDITLFQTDLHTVSAFQFENYLHILKKMVKSTHNPLAQIYNRISEMDSCGAQEKHKHMHTKVSLKKDCWFLLNCERFAYVTEIISPSQFICQILYTRDGRNFFTAPCRSSLLNIYKFHKTLLVQASKKQISRSEFIRKVVCIPHRTYYVLIPLISAVM